MVLCNGDVLRIGICVRVGRQTVTAYKSFSFLYHYPCFLVLFFCVAFYSFHYASLRCERLHCAHFKHLSVYNCSCLISSPQLSCWQFEPLRTDSGVKRSLKSCLFVLVLNFHWSYRLTFRSWALQFVCMFCFSFCLLPMLSLCVRVFFFLVVTF